MHHLKTPSDLLRALTDPEAERLLGEALTLSPDEVARRLVEEGYDLDVLREDFHKMLEDLPRRIALYRQARALDPVRPEPRIVRSSIAEAEPILARIALDLCRTRPRSETSVAIVHTFGQDVYFEWLHRVTLAKRARDLLRSDASADIKQMCRVPLEALERPQVPGTVLVLVPGEHVVLPAYVDASDLRATELLTTFHGGTA